MFQCDCIEASLDSEQYNGILTKVGKRFLLPHAQHLYGKTSATYTLNRKTTAEIREFGRQIYLWKCEGVLVLGCFLSVFLASSCNLALRINIVWLQALFFFLSCYFRLLFSMSNSFLPVFLCAFHF